MILCIFAGFSLLLADKFPDFSLTGKFLPVFQVFESRWEPCKWSTVFRLIIAPGAKTYFWGGAIFRNFIMPILHLYFTWNLWQNKMKCYLNSCYVSYYSNNVILSEKSMVFEYISQCQQVGGAIIVKRRRCSPDSVLQGAFKREPRVDHCKYISPVRLWNA